MKTARRLIAFALILLVTVSATVALAATSPYPNKDIFVYIFSSQGGGTDVWTRHLAALMEKELKVNIVCSNLPGANGGTGGMKVWNAPHDGYTVLGASETALFFGVNDASPVAKNWEFFIGGGSPGVIAVNAKSDYKTIRDLVKAARKSPEKVKISNSGHGKLWHIKALQLEQGAKVKFLHVPYNGSAPAITALLSREVDAVSASAGEIVEHVRGGLLRPLIMTETVSLEFENFGLVKAATSSYPSLKTSYANLFQWLGFMMPYDAPKEAQEAFGRAFENAVKHAKTDEFVKVQSARKIGLWGPKAKELALKMESVASWISKDLGLAKKDPVELGIPKPK